MQPNTAAVDDLSAFPFLNSQAILDDLKTELPLYLAKAVDVDSSVSVMDWWRQNATHLPKWSSALQKVLLVQPSSAALKGYSRYSTRHSMTNKSIRCRITWKHL